MSDSDPDWDVALSFAGEQRDYVQVVADRLRALNVRVFYDSYAQVDLWGKDLYAHLDQIYRFTSRYCVIFISADYGRKLWTNHERKSAQARAFSSNTEYILPARFDDTDIPGILPTSGFLDLRLIKPDQLADRIAEKLGQISPSRAEGPTSTTFEAPSIATLILPPIDATTKKALAAQAREFVNSLNQVAGQSPIYYSRLQDISTMGDRDIRPAAKLSIRRWSAIDQAIQPPRELLSRIDEALAPRGGWPWRPRSSILTATDLKERADAVLRAADALTVLGAAIHVDVDTMWSNLIRLHEYVFISSELQVLVHTPSSPLYGEVTNAASLRLSEFNSALDARCREYLSLQEAKRGLERAAKALSELGTRIKRAAEVPDLDGARLQEMLRGLVVATLSQLQSLNALKLEALERSAI